MARGSRTLDRAIATHALNNPDALRLMTVPGVSVITSTTFVAAIGDIRRFHSARHLVGYLGLDPKVRQSGNTPARHGPISKQGSAAVRHERFPCGPSGEVLGRRCFASSSNSRRCRLARAEHRIAVSGRARSAGLARAGRADVSGTSVGGSS